MIIIWETESFDILSPDHFCRRHWLNAGPASKPLAHPSVSVFVRLRVRPCRGSGDVGSSLTARESHWGDGHHDDLVTLTNQECHAPAMTNKRLPSPQHPPPPPPNQALTSVYVPKNDQWRVYQAEPIGQLGEYSRTSYDISWAPDWSRWPSRPIRNPR